MWYRLVRSICRLVVPDLLTRMIGWELLKVFGMSLLGITSILLIAGVVAEATQQGLTVSQIIRIIPLLVPSTLPYTIPATTLFATCVIYGRLAADNEILAIKAAGVNIVKVVWPAVALGFVMSCTTMVLYYHLIPHTHGLMRQMLFNEVEEALYGLLRRDKKLSDPRSSVAVYVQHVQGRKLIRSVFKRRAPEGPAYDLVAYAREADLRVDLSRRQLLLHMRNGTVLYKGTTNGYFDDRIWPIPLPTSIGLEKSTKPRDLTWREILEYRKAREEEGIAKEEEAKVAAALAESGLGKCRRELAGALAAGPLGPLHTATAVMGRGSGMMVTSDDSLCEVPADQLAAHALQLREQGRYARGDVRSLTAELYMRPALAFGCLCFVLVGCPVGIWFSRSDYLSAFVSCFLPIVFLYYPLMLCGMNLAKDGKLHPAPAILFADVLLILISLFMFHRLLKN
jgi:lipopolysaccharide export system permease protein